MKENIFLSVIIPVYNAEHYLPQCLGSLLAAAQEDMEIILIDDGSTDESAELIRSYGAKHHRVHLLQQKNAGPSAARNKGLSHARGRYIAFIDADDYVDTQAFIRQLELIRRSNADIWASDFRRVADNGCVLDEVFQIKDTQQPIFDNAYLLDFLAAKDCVWNVWRYIFRKEFLEKNALLFAEGYSIAEDLELVVRAFGCGPELAFFHDPYYYYRVNYGASLTRRFSAEKLRQLVTMLSRAYAAAGGDAAGELLRIKLSREYILNLSSLYEVEAAERKAAAAALTEGRCLMESASGAYKYAAKAVKLLGLPVSAWILYAMKRLKRLKRQVKTSFFDRG